MVKITMRLYRMNDLDLMYLYKMPNVSIQSIIKVMLKNYIKDRNNGGKISDRLQIPHIKHSTPLPSSAQFHIILQDGEDDDVISWIEQIPKGLRNSLLKNMLRSYLDFPLVAPYETDIIKEIKPTNKNDISIDKYNNVINNRAKNTIIEPASKKEIISETEKEDTINQVFDTPITSENKPQNIKSKTADKVLSVNNGQNKKDNISDKSDEQGDLFDEFESMMNNF